MTHIFYPPYTGSLNSDGSPLLCALRASEAAELKELLLEGSRPLQSSVTLDSNTCCIIKPHAIKAKLAGKIVDHLIAQVRESILIKEAISLGCCRTIEH